MRLGLDAALKYMRPGDTLVVWKLDRLGCSLPHLIDTIQALDERGIGFRSLHEYLDTATPGVKPIFHLFGALAGFERDLIGEGSNAELVAVRAGPAGERPPALDARRAARAVALYREGQLSPAEIGRTVGCGRSTCVCSTLAT